MRPFLLFTKNLNLYLRAMGQKKLQRFNEIKGFANVLEYPEGMQGNWNTFFKNPNPITLELACGRGEYTVGMAALYPDRNFIGVDIKGNRLYIGAKKAITQPLKNVAFLRTQIETLGSYFSKGEVDEIWITFPDPQLRTSRAKKRLTHPRFLRIFQSVLSNGGALNLKTDSPALFHFTKRVADMYQLTILDESEDLYSKTDLQAEFLIKTHYEALDIAGSNKIFYLKLQLPEVIPDRDEELQDILRQTENQQPVS